MSDTQVNISIKPELAWSRRKQMLDLAVGAFAQKLDSEESTITDAARKVYSEAFYTASAMLEELR